ncbi:MAG: hypothetical protein CMF60_04755 [Magnetococcales bacterium]|nr:hypothetical protein [Magnetococcales bacterium]
MNKFKKWATGIAVSATAVVGLSSMKQNELENTQSIDAPDTTSQTVDIDTSSPAQQGAEVGANFNLDKDNPEINTSPTQKDLFEELARELKQNIIHNMNKDDVRELSLEDRKAVVHQMAKDYRACEKSMEMTGGIDPELVGENNYCSKYFREDKILGLWQVQHLQEMAELVMTEEYAQHLDGLPKTVQQQPMYDSLGEDFSKIYHAHSEFSEQSANQAVADAQSFLESHLGDISHLEGEELADLQERIDTLKQEYLQQVTEKLDAQDLSDTEYVYQKELAKGKIDALSKVERYQKNYGKDMTEQKPLSAEHTFDDPVDFARKIHLVAEKFGIDPNKIKMSQSPDDNSLIFNANNLDDQIDLGDDMSR